MEMTNKIQSHQHPKNSASLHEGREKETNEDVYANADIRPIYSKEFVDLYENVYLNDDVLDLQKTRSYKRTTTLSTDMFQHTQDLKETNREGIRCYRLAALCLILLCFLLLTSITVLWVKATTERDQLHISYKNLSIQRDQLQTSYNNLTIETDQLLNSFNNLTTEIDKLLVEKNKLYRKLSQLEDANTQRWMYSSSRLYYITTEKKSWSETRKECRERGGDLVIINSQEEQEVIGKMFGSMQAWIGLTDSVKEGVWKWVDGTELSTEFWWTGEPNNYGGDEDCTITGYTSAKSTVQTWADFPCNHPVIGICERVLTEPF